jgi:hypothetical protein
MDEEGIVKIWKCVDPDILVGEFDTETPVKKIIYNEQLDAYVVVNQNNTISILELNETTKELEIAK